VFISTSLWGEDKSYTVMLGSIINIKVKHMIKKIFGYLGFEIIIKKSSVSRKKEIETFHLLS
jgi:hypothetical protein